MHRGAGILLVLAIACKTRDTEKSPDTSGFDAAILFLHPTNQAPKSECPEGSSKPAPDLECAKECNSVGPTAECPTGYMCALDHHCKGASLHCSSDTVNIIGPDGGDFCARPCMKNGDCQQWGGHGPCTMHATQHGQPAAQGIKTCAPDRLPSLY